MSSNSVRTLLFFAVIFAAGLAGARACQAHYLWLKTIGDDARPQVLLTFGDTASEETFPMPDELADVNLYRRAAGDQRAELHREKVDTEDRSGLVADLPRGKPCVVETSGRYGLYRESLLVYYAKHVHAAARGELGNAGPSKQLKLDVAARAVGDRVELTVLWDGSPLAGSDVSLAIGDAEPVRKTTDGEGHVTWQPDGSGLVSVVARHIDKEDAGQVDGEAYDRTSHYTTLTFPWTAGQPAGNASLPALPEAVASFGGAVADGWLYVYGGHIGTAHDHSSANLSPHFCRLRLAGGRAWEELPMDLPLQGLALVAHGGRLYRVGGMNARNATPDDEEDLHSVADFARFDSASGEWTALAPLPAPRSSLDAVVIGDRLYVVGGWTLAGSRDGTWLDHALVYDLADPDAGWQQLPTQPFRRRALAAGRWQDMLVAIGGIDQGGDVSTRVDLFDPATGQWSQGPDLPSHDDMAGFGVSAWNLRGRLCASGSDGVVYLLADDGKSWESVARLARPRFFHRLLPADPETLVAVGGATEDGHLANVEVIRVDHAVAAR